MKHTAAKPVTTQKVATITYVRFKVTTCLYLSPNNRESSLSTLIAVDVNKDTNIMRSLLWYLRRMRFDKDSSLREQWTSYK